MPRAMQQVSKMRVGASKMLRLVCAVVLAFSLAVVPSDPLTGQGSSAYAADSGDSPQKPQAGSSGDADAGEDTSSGGSAQKPDPEEPDSGKTEVPEKPDPEDPKVPEAPDPAPQAPTIIGLSLRFDGLTGQETGITYQDGLRYGDLLASSFGPSDAVKATITAKGQTVQLFALGTWSDDSEGPAASYVQWSSSDPSIAKVSPAGLVTPVSDGKVRIDCTANSANTAAGTAVTVRLWLEMKGQTDNRYVESVSIIDQQGRELGDTPVVLDETIEEPAAFLRLAALVKVVDPKTGASQIYDTRQGTLGSQAEDLADLEWSVNAADMGFVDSTGLYRPKEYGVVVVYAESPAGKAGARVRGSATIQTTDPLGNTQPDFHPQETLTIKAYYETMPPENPQDPDDGNFVINKKYTLDELQGLGVQTATYTSLSSTSYYTVNASGVPVAAVLRDAGVNLDGVATLEFGTFDGYTTPLSYDFLYQPRYYYPNIGNADNKYAGAEQVYPIFAFNTSRVRNGDTAKSYDSMSEATRYELVFGATPAGDTSQYQVKWIHTLYVVLAGGPPVLDGDNPQDLQKKPDSGSRPADNPAAPGNDPDDPDDPDDPEEPDEPVPGLGPGDGDAGPGGGSASGSGTDSGLPGSGGAQNLVGFSDGGEGTFSIYQIMNRNPSETEAEPVFDNPYKKLVAPAVLLVLVIGALQAALWYKRQSRAMPMGPSPPAVAGA